VLILAIMKAYPLAVIIVLLALPGEGAQKPAALCPFGVQLHSMSAGVEAHKAALNLCMQAGVKLIRDEILWDCVEPQKGVLKLDDDIVQNVENTLKAGIEPVIVLGYGNPLYDDGNAPVSKEAAAGFARYCEFMARTFKGKVRYWEVWNEPNTERFWKLKPDPKGYAGLLKAAYKACKKGNPACTVIGVCTSGIDLAFVEEALKQGAKDMDALSVHPDGSEPSKMVEELTKLRQTMDEHGAKRVPIWITEVGLPTPDGMNPEKEARALIGASVEAIAAGVSTVFWRWFGEDGSPKPAYTAYRTMALVLDGATYARSMYIGESVRAHVFAKGESNTAVLWCTAGVRSVTFDVGTNEVTVVDGLSAEGAALTPLNGMVTLTLTETPSYLTRQALIEQMNVLPGNPFQFLPEQAALAAGEKNSVGIGAVNVGAEMMTGKVSILSDRVTPSTHDFSLSPGERTILVSQIDVPASAPQNLLRIPAEVEVGGKICARLQLLIKITPPAAH